MPQYDLNVRDYLRIFRKHRYYLVIPPLVLVALTYVLTPAPTVSYKATASIKISQSTTLAGLLLQVFTYSSGDNIATQTRVLTSLPLMAKPRPAFGARPKDLDFKAILAIPEHVAQLSTLALCQAAEQVGNTNIVQINAEAATREEAKSIHQWTGRCIRAMEPGREEPASHRSQGLHRATARAGRTSIEGSGRRASNLHGGQYRSSLVVDGRDGPFTEGEDRYSATTGHPRAAGRAARGTHALRLRRYRLGLDCRAG